MERLSARSAGQARNDDALEVVARRLETYRATTRPLVDYYLSTGRLLQIDGSRPVEAVTELILAGLSSCG